MFMRNEKRVCFEPKGKKKDTVVSSMGRRLMMSSNERKDYKWGRESDSWREMKSSLKYIYTSKEMDSIVRQLSPVPRSSNPVISKESQMW